MLFDLRGRGRQRTIKVVYVTLAFLLGGGLVLFGIGGDVSGGLVDAITQRGSGDTGEERFREREQAALAKTRANPQDPRAWAELVRARIQLAGAGDRFDPNTNDYTDEGRAQLRQAAAAWDKYLALDPEKPDDRVASLMARGFESLGDLEGAARAQEIVAVARPSAGTYSQLAVLSYSAGLTRKGDLASREALRRTDKDMRNQLEQQLEQAKQQAIAEQVAPQPTP